jgi:hypothetical protein
MNDRTVTVFGDRNKPTHETALDVVDLADLKRRALELS